MSIKTEIRNNYEERGINMGVVIGKLDGQVEKIFLGDNLTKSVKDYDALLEDETLTEEERRRILLARKKKEEDDIIL